MTETKSRVGTGVSMTLDPGAEVKSAMTGFVKEYSDFQAEMKTVLQ